MTSAGRSLFGIAFVLLTGGCKGNGGSAAVDAETRAVVSATPPATSAAPSVALSATASAAAPARPGGCPTAVTGATATAADTKDGIAVTIVTKDPAAAADVRDRAHALAMLGQHGVGGGGQGGGGGGGDGTGPGPGDGSGKGSAGGGGSGSGLGRCPILLRSVTLDVQDTKDGAIITMHPKRAHDLDNVRSQVRTRLSGG